MKKYIVIVCLGLLLIMTGLIYQNVLLKESDNQNNNISDNNSEVNNDNINNNTIIVDDSFHCVLDQQSNNSATSLNYKKEKYYNFDIKDEKVVYGELEIKYFFDTKESYDNFQYDERMFSIEPYENNQNEEELSKSYYYFIILNSNYNNISEYLENLKTQNYYCEKLYSDEVEYEE